VVKENRPKNLINIPVVLNKHNKVHRTIKASYLKEAFVYIMERQG
jgi:hypothetical protein